MLPSAYTFGWNILDKNLTAGSVFGYSSENSITGLKVPSSKDVPSGPNITAFQCMMLFSDSAPLTRAGGSSCNHLKSRISLLQGGSACSPAAPPSAWKLRSILKVHEHLRTNFRCSAGCSWGYRDKSMQPFPSLGDLGEINVTVGRNYQWRASVAVLSNGACPTWWDSMTHGTCSRCGGERCLGWLFRPGWSDLTKTKGVGQIWRGRKEGGRHNPLKGLIGCIWSHLHTLSHSSPNNTVRSVRRFILGKCRDARQLVQGLAAKSGRWRLSDFKFFLLSTTCVLCRALCISSSPRLSPQIQAWRHTCI